MDKEKIIANLNAIESEAQYILYSKKPREVKEVYFKNIKSFSDKIKESLKEGD